MAAKAEQEEPLTQVKRSRRELLAGAAGALGVLAAEAIGGAAPARAADGDPLILGSGSNSATSETDLSTDTAETAFQVFNSRLSQPAVAISGHAVSTGDNGTLGYDAGPGAQAGVAGFSDHLVGVLGFTIDGAAFVGQVAGGGRGGIFQGGKAQVKLHPSSASTHPKRGQKGDLFVDKSGRLWFCKGRYTWVQLA